MSQIKLKCKCWIRSMFYESRLHTAVFNCFHYFSLRVWHLCMSHIALAHSVLPKYLQSWEFLKETEPLPSFISLAEFNYAKCSKQYRLLFYLWSFALNNFEILCILTGISDVFVYLGDVFARRENIAINTHTHRVYQNIFQQT